jgi:nucleoside-diphosphate-sugar epimerase
MQVLIVGGTGIISAACVERALSSAIDVTVLNRGSRGRGASQATQITGDVNCVDETAQLIGNKHWDAVVDFVAYRPAEIEQRIALFRERTDQYIFISSASAYQKPATDYLISESTPLCNPYWQYSRDKIACEERLLREYRDASFPVTIVRPSFTYGNTALPLALNVWGKTFTVVERMRRGLPVIVPGDGLSLWTLTHNTDFAKGIVGLFGNPLAIGHAFHITSDEVLTWNQIYRIVAAAAGVPEPDLVHIASDFLAAVLPGDTGGLLGDKSNSAVFDNSKIKHFVPDFQATTRFSEGIAKTIAWFDAEPSRQVVDEPASARWDRLIAAYRRAREMVKESL